MGEKERRKKGKGGEVIYYLTDVWSDRIVEGSLFNVLRNKLALVLDDVQCQSLVYISQIVCGQVSAIFCTDRHARECVSTVLPIHVL